MLKVVLSLSVLPYLLRTGRDGCGGRAPVTQTCGQRGLSTSVVKTLTVDMKFRGFSGKVGRSEDEAGKAITALALCFPGAAGAFLFSTCQPPSS